MLFVQLNPKMELIIGSFIFWVTTLEVIYCIPSCSLHMYLAIMPLNTPPTHLGHRHRGRPPHRRSLRLILHSLPPHRCDEFQRCRGWFQLTTLEPLDSIPAPQRRHWEDNHWYYWGLLQQWILADNTNYPYAYDDTSDAPINADTDARNNAPINADTDTTNSPAGQ